MSTNYVPIKMTSKGTFTLPAKVRKDFGLSSEGDIIWLSHTPGSRHAGLEAPTTTADLRALVEKISAAIPREVLDASLDLDAVRTQMHQERWQRHGGTTK